MREEDIIPHQEQIIRFLGEKVDTRGYINLKTTFGMGRVTKTIKISYLVMEESTSYNILSRWLSLNKL